MANKNTTYDLLYTRYLIRDPLFCQKYILLEANILAEAAASRCPLMAKLPDRQTLSNSTYSSLWKAGSVLAQTYHLCHNNWRCSVG